MGTHVINLPDIGEGIAEAELTVWSVSVGDMVEEDDILGEVMTDKAAVEVPTTVAGRVTWLCGEPGDMIAIGSRFVTLDVEGAGNAPDDVGQAPSEEAPETVETEDAQAATPAPQTPVIRGEPWTKPRAAPSVRRRAREAGVALSDVAGTGPGGRVLLSDLTNHLEGRKSQQSLSRKTGVEEVKVIGLRRKIAQQMALSKSRIPHITIVEEVDVTDLEVLRAKLNALYGDKRGKLTLLPFLIRALREVVPASPAVNATYDDEAQVVTRHEALHVGIATQTDGGLKVPVLRHAEAATLWNAADELRRLAQAARDGTAAPADLSGSTITISSLGPLGAIATTPIINHPEVAIVGVNKIAMRPVWDGNGFAPRSVMNLSCSFDHRVIDGWDAAVFVQEMKTALETPSLMFVEA
ncbi:MAG: dihydrolipoamide acetyltransferase family protein [Pseudomonadota bacterium]|nr:dihydrolipoamide acetyltransferase family protein [Pseudomonadota bacterium]